MASRLLDCENCDSQWNALALNWESLRPKRLELGEPRLKRTCTIIARPNDVAAVVVNSRDKTSPSRWKHGCAKGAQPTHLYYARLLSSQSAPHQWSLIRLSLFFPPVRILVVLLPMRPHDQLSGTAFRQTNVSTIAFDDRGTAASSCCGQSSILSRKTVFVETSLFWTPGLYETLSVLTMLVEQHTER